MNREIFLSQCYTVDFETTGLDFDTAEIVEQGVSAFTNNKWFTFCSELHDCSIEVPPEASAVNNITSDMLDGLPYFTYENFAKGAIDPDNSIIVSHNAPYDSGVFEKYVESESIYNSLTDKWLCTLRMMRKLHANDESFSGFGLCYLRYRLKLNGVGDAHRAGFDSYITGLLLSYIIDELESMEFFNEDQSYFDQLYEWSNKPIIIERMPLAKKYLGQPIKEIPNDYLGWCLDTFSELDIESPNFNMDLFHTIMLQTGN